MIKRTLGPCKPDVKQTAYKLLIHPKLEYSSSIWNPHTISQVNSLERVQHSAARFVKNYYRRKTYPTNLITALEWPTLERRLLLNKPQPSTKFYITLRSPPPIPTNPLSNLWTIRRPQVSYKCNGLFILSLSNSHMEYDPTKNYQHKKPKSFQEAIMELPFITPPHLNCL